jgi:hypothetical protein
VIWITPRSGDRVLATPPGRFATWVRRLDWTGRFTLTQDSRLTLHDRGGVTRHDTAAMLMVLSRLPLTFPLAAPLLLPGVRSLWYRR